MWLPPDERRLLQAYYVRIAEIDEDCWFRIASWCAVLRLRSRNVNEHAMKVREYGEDETAEPEHQDAEQQTAAVVQYIEDERRISRANAALAKRGLVVLEHHESELSVFGLSLTVEGYDQGRRYANWLTRTGEWWKEYHGHWLGLGVSFLAGAVLTKIVDCLF